MARAYRSASDDPYNPYYPRHYGKKRFWQQAWFWPVVIIGGIFLLLVILSISGKLRSPGGVGVNESEVVVSQEQQLVNYVLSQREAGVTDQDIKSKLLLAGFSDNDVNRALNLSDPMVQYIIKRLGENVSKVEIIDELLKQGVDPATIQQKFAVIEDKPSGLAAFVKKNWLWLILIVVAAYFIFRKAGVDAGDKAPKIFTLEQCREYAEEKLKEKNINHNPCIKYRNRPELKQYRYAFDEPNYPEFNSHLPWGHVAGKRKYFLVAVGYDKELVDFRITDSDMELRDFLYGKPANYESRGASEYMRLKERSEMSPDQLREAARKDYERVYGGSVYPRNYRRPVPRTPTPGPIESYEEV